MQLQSLFSTEIFTEEKKEIPNLLELNISQLSKEISDYLEKIKDLTELGFHFSIQDNNFSYTKEVFLAGGIAFFVSNVLLLAALPGSGFIKMALIAGIVGAGVYKYFSIERGIYKNEINYVKEKTKILQSLFKNDEFKILLIVNIEKNFNTLEEKFQSKTDTLLMIKKKKDEMLNELKTILIDEDLNNLQKLLYLLTNIKEIEEQTQKLLKLENLNSEVYKQLNVQVSHFEEENEITEKIKSLL
jgi:hypothetical protein